eukprot:m.213931 g.213931  ORF g.213931 m.213931 type:complete len:60 (+) comp10143_c2_seq3:234-413(+)
MLCSGAVERKMLDLNRGMTLFKDLEDPLHDLLHDYDYGYSRVLVAVHKVLLPMIQRSLQ